LFVSWAEKNDLLPPDVAAFVVGSGEGSRSRA